jgi:hypothetical protein
MATDLPERVEPIRPKEKQPFSGGSIVSSLRTGIPLVSMEAIGISNLIHRKYIS